MLVAFLKVIKDGNLMSMLEVAQKLQIAPGMAYRIAEELAHKGYLEEVGVDCGTPGSGCTGCPAGGSCGSHTRRWLLTAKGDAAAGRFGPE